MGLGAEMDGTFTLRQAGAINPSKSTNSLSPVVDTAVVHYPSSGRYYLMGAGISGLIQSVDITNAVSSSLKGMGSTIPTGNTVEVNKVTANANSELTPLSSGTTLTNTPGQIIGAAPGSYPRIALSGQKLYYLSQTQKAFVVDLSLEIPCGNLMKYMNSSLSSWTGNMETATLNLRSELATTDSDLVPWNCTAIKKVQTVPLTGGKSVSLTKESVCCKPRGLPFADAQCCSRKSANSDELIKSANSVELVKEAQDELMKF